jgi:hypothetical protein
VLAPIVLLYSVGAYAETKLAPLPDAWCTLRLRSTKTGNAEVQWAFMAGIKITNRSVALYSNRIFRTFGAPSKPLRSAKPLSIRE